MAKNAQFIYGGGGDVVLYDAVNGWYSLGYLQELIATFEGPKVETVMAQMVQFFTMYKVTLKNLQSNAALVAELVTRRTALQTIYVTGAGKLFTFPNMLINYNPNHPFNSSDAHTIDISFQTGVEPTQQENLLGTSGQFETDAGGGIATGWLETGALAAKSVAASHLAGEGNAQLMEVSGADPDAGIYKATTCPFEGTLKVTFSAYIKAVAASDFNMVIMTFDTSDVVITIYTKAISMTLNEETRQEFAQTINEGEIVKSVRVYIQGDNSNTADLNVDNAQLELGGLKDFRAT